VIEINKPVLDEMIAHAKALNPVESCGYLAGQNGQVTTLYKMTNVDNSPEHFSFDPKEQFAVIKDARNAGLTVMGVYHSHPESPARLSEEDLRLLNDPNMVYVIVSLWQPTPDVKAFRIIKADNEVHIVSVQIKGA
jgi:[CysO sulfur-carrier protein]-S-L-cysteine hydrolase